MGTYAILRWRDARRTRYINDPLILSGGSKTATPPRGTCRAGPLSSPSPGSGCGPRARSRGLSATHRLHSSRVHRHRHPARAGFREPASRTHALAQAGEKQTLRRFVHMYGQRGAHPRTWYRPMSKQETCSGPCSGGPDLSIFQEDAVFPAAPRLARARQRMLATSTIVDWNETLYALTRRALCARSSHSSRPSC